MQHYPASVLLVATRRIGDVLLNTPLLRSMRNAWPAARIDVLVFKGTAGMLEGNPDCNEVMEIDYRPGARGYLHWLRRLFRRYDLAVTTQAGDRPHMLAWVAGRRRVGLINGSGAETAWKRALADCTAIDHRNTHMVVQNLALTPLLGIAATYEVVPPSSPSAEGELDALLPFDWRRQPYAVLHPYPNYRYKEWTDAEWLALIEHLRRQGWQVVLTGGSDRKEVDGCTKLVNASSSGVTSLAGRVGFGCLSRLLAGARCYVGADTSTTHLAAACGTPTVALFGPSNPMKWGPWPMGCTTSPSPWLERASPWQRQANVVVMQGGQDCVPCHGEGCDRHPGSSSRCLTEMPAASVVAALDELLREHAEDL